MKYPDRKLLAAVIPPKSALYSSLLLAGILASGSAHATLSVGSVLKFTAGVTTCSGGGVPPCGSYQTTNVATGSWFGMDTDGNLVISAGEKTALAPLAGVPIGSTTTATGSHSGAATGAENPGIDLPWGFFGNTGMDFLASPVTVLSGSGTTSMTLDLSGWRVTWNGIPAINMGSGNWGAGAGSGIASLTCSTASCNTGDTFTLNYFAIVPAGDLSGFGGVHYQLHLTGSVVVPGPLTSDTGPVSAGVTGVAGNRLSQNDLTSHGIPLDPDSSFQYPQGLYYDFTVPVGIGTTANVVIPLASPLPAHAVYRKYNPNTATWSTFNTTAGNAIASAPGTPGSCPVPGNVAYTPGLTQGNYCIQLTIVNSGPDDTDLSATTISDPGGVATGVLSAQADTRTSGSSGCSISPKPIDPLKRSDWLLLLGFVAWLGWYRRKRQN